MLASCLVGLFFFFPEEVCATREDVESCKFLVQLTWSSRQSLLHDNGAVIFAKCLFKSHCRRHLVDTGKDSGVLAFVLFWPLGFCAVSVAGPWKKVFFLKEMY